MARDQTCSFYLSECLVKLMERCWRQEQLEPPDMTIVVNDIQLLLSEEDIKSELVKAIVNLLNSSYRPSSNLGPELTHRSETNSEKEREIVSVLSSSTLNTEENESISTHCLKRKRNSFCIIV